LYDPPECVAYLDYGEPRHFLTSLLTTINFKAYSLSPIFLNPTWIAVKWGFDASSLPSVPADDTAKCITLFPGAFLHSVLKTSRHSIFLVPHK
jgi:hypothetical protein